MLEEISGDELLRQKYYAREKARLDEISRIKYAEMKGMEKGMEKATETVARNLLKEGADIALVVKATGLSKERVEELKYQK